MIFGATIFNPSQSKSTRSLSVMDFLKTIGGTDGTKKKDDLFKSIDPDIDNIMEHDTIDEAYVDSLTRMNEIGLALAGKGYNVLSPQSSDPAAKSAAGYFQLLNNQANKNLVALKTHKDKFELEQKLRLEKGVIDLNPGNEADPNSLVNTETIESMNGKGIEEANDVLAKEFATKDQAGEANQKLDQVRNDLPAAIEETAKALGIKDPDMIKALTDGFVNRVGLATDDPLTDLRKLKLQSEIDKNKAGANAANALAKKRREQKKDDSPEGRASFRKEMIYRNQHGDQLDALIGGKFGKGIITGAEFDRSADQSRIILEIDKGGFNSGNEEYIDASDFNNLNNIYESISGRSMGERFPIEELAKYPDVSAERQAAIKNEIGWQENEWTKEMDDIAIAIDKKQNKENASKITRINGKKVKFVKRSLWGGSLIYEDEDGNEVSMKKDYDTIKKHLKESMGTPKANSPKPTQVNQSYQEEEETLFGDDWFEDE